MKPEFKTGRGKIECEAPQPKKQAVPSKSYKARKSSAAQQGVKFDPKFNDVSWYTKYPALFSDASTVGFNHIKGTQYFDALANSSNRPTYGTNVMDPSVLVIRYITSPGVCTSADSGFEMQVRRLYLAMKRKYRGLNTYQVPDLGITLFCIGEFYRMIAKLERIYGVVNYYNATNRIMPSTLPQSLRIDYANISEHLADFRAGINALIARAHSLCLPNGLDFVNRWFLLESNVFKDSQGNRAGYIMFDDSDIFYTYQSTFSSNGGAAVLSNIAGQVNDPEHWAYNELLDAASDILGLLLNDDDVTLQLGDIISYFTKDNGDTDLLTLSPLPEDYVVTPVYNADILLQIHNSTTIGDDFGTVHTGTITPANFEQGDNATLGYQFSYAQAYTAIWQVNGHLSFDPYLGNALAANNTVYFDQSAGGAQVELKFRAGNLILDTWEDKPSAEHVMEMTRLTTACKVQPYVVSTNYYHSIRVTACGTEMVLSYVVNSPQNNDQSDGLHSTSILDLSAVIAPVMCELSKFAWHPIMYLLTAFGTTTAMGSSWVLSSDVFGDFDNAKVFTPEVLHRIHDAAVMSLFDVSSVRALLPEK